MAEPFLSEIRMMTFNFPPKGWAFCNGQLLPINQNQGLFSLLGTTYGGNGQTNFALPNLQGRTPIHMGAGHTLGESAGSTSSTLTVSELPLHFHLPQAASTAATTATPGTTVALAQSVGSQIYGPASNLTAMAPSTVSQVGGSQSHNNMQPYLTINFCIALQGIFPSQT